MDSAKNSRKVFCSLPQHEDEHISMIDSDPDCKKLLYCCLCMMEQSAQNSLPKTLTTFKNFISSTSKAFEKARSNAHNQGEAPAGFADQISRKGEYLEKLTNNLDQQKTQLKDVFDKIREYILSVIDEKEKEYEKTIGDELRAVCDLYGEFERILTAGWPKPSDFAHLCPVQSEIEQRFAKATDVLQLESLIENLKEDIKASEMFSGEKGKETRMIHLENLMNSFKEIEANPPNIDLTELQIGKLEEQLKEKLDQIIAEKALILNPISQKSRILGSSLLQAKDLVLLRNWLPGEFGFNLKLLYKSSTDGQAASVFHEKCDNKGPTITVIKCRFNGDDKSTILGGFTDQNWHTNTSYEASQESFLFSLSAQVKCPIATTQYAIYGRPDYGPTFGGGHDIHIADNFAQTSYFRSNSYQNAQAIVDSPGYQDWQLGLQPEEVEVFSVN